MAPGLRASRSAPAGAGAAEVAVGGLDEGNGRYTLRVPGVAGQTAHVVLRVERTVLTGRTVIYF